MMGYMYHIPDAEIGFYSLGVSLSEYGWLIPGCLPRGAFLAHGKG